MFSYSLAPCQPKFFFLQGVFCHLLARLSHCT
jgi:hypothetical protein